jgi:alpha-beta hydrolase superfamily lysophospholipase
MTNLAWRLAPLADSRRVDVALRLFGARALLLGGGASRLDALGLPHDVSAETLRRVRAIDDWDVAWTWAAQRFLGEARIFARSGNADAAALQQRHAALAYHLGAALVFDNTRTIRTLRASASTLFARALNQLRPAVQRREIRWRTLKLPAYLAFPSNATRPSPLVVILNGTSTSKEETLLWGDAFLERDMAVLALDWPGSGESALSVAPTAECEDFTDGVFELAESEPGLDARRVALLGFSLGGAIAARAASADRRIAAIVAVTPPYDARVWLAGAQPLLKRHLATLAGGANRAVRLAGAFAVPELLPRTRCPVLVLGAGRDVIVPPHEAMRYCAAVADRGTLLWYPEGSHGLYEYLPEWTAEAAAWLQMRFYPEAPSTQVDAFVRAYPQADRRPDENG